MGNCIGTQLASVDFNKVSLFTFAGKIESARVTDVYDGDTVTIGVLLDRTPFRFKFRLAGIDTPEKKPLLLQPDRELHIAAATAAGQFLARQIKDRIVWIKFEKEEKYGRLMGYIYLSKEELERGPANSINQLMINRGFAQLYHGKKKTEFTHQQLTYMVGKNER